MLRRFALYSHDFYVLLHKTVKGQCLQLGTKFLKHLQIIPFTPSLLMTHTFVCYDRISFILRKLNCQIQYGHQFKAVGVYFKTMRTSMAKCNSIWSFLSEVPPATRNDLQLADFAAIGISRKLLSRSYPCRLQDEQWRAADDREWPHWALARHATVCHGSSSSFPHPNCHIACRWASKFWRLNSYTGPLFYRHLAPDLSWCLKNM